jgi:hypothetical protein
LIFSRQIVEGRQIWLKADSRRLAVCHKADHADN